MITNILEYLPSDANVDQSKVSVRDGDLSLTLTEVKTASERLAIRIVQKTENVNAVVAVFLPKSALVPIANLAILLSGNAFTNLDTKSPPQRLTRLLDNLQPVMILTTSQFHEELVGLGVSDELILLIDDETTPDVDSKPAYSIPERRRKFVLDTDPMCVINTSGSTGTPKSVVLSHRAVIDFVEWVLETFDFDENDRFGSLSPFFFDIYLLELFVALASGSQLHIIPETSAAFPQQIVQYLLDQEITFIFWVPTIMVNIANLNLLNLLSQSKLKRVFFAGEVFPTKPLNAWRTSLPNAQFVNLYGPIEIAVDCTFYILDRNFRDDEPIPIGRACKNTGLLVLSETDHEVVPGEIGELCVRGSSLASGYFNDWEQTNRVFVQNPLNKSFPERIYRTGDLVRADEEGNLYFVGRKDFQVKHLGYRIELLEIENAALTIPEIANACVLYDPKAKDIVLVYESAVKQTLAALRKQLSRLLPKYMLPSRIEQCERMPMNANGKIDRQGLKQSYGVG